MTRLANRPQVPGPTDAASRSADRMSPVAGHNGRMRQQPAAKSSPWQRSLFARLLKAMGKPPVVIVLWDGEEIAVSDESPVAWVHIRDQSTLLRMILDPYFQFGEAYTDRRLEVEGDLVELLVAIDRAGSSPQARGVAAALLSRWLRRPRGTSLSRARENIYHHYDVGNDFYRLWLDDELAYTCAYFPTPEASLEEAQIAKFDHVCRKVDLRPGETVVEAGCGWGGFALHMAREYDVEVKAYNISHEQIAFARQRAKEEGLADKVEFIEDDWRNIQGRYDAFMSIGMLEHVGPRNYRQLGEVIHRCLPPHGRGLVHSIGRNYPRRLDPWIERRIFPGAYAPSLRQMLEIFEPRKFTVHDVENLGRHYAVTLGHWLSRFEESVDRITAMYDERFVRMWRVYLAGSRAAFRAGSLQLFQVAFARTTSDRMPWTRAGLYRRAEDEVERCRAPSASES